VYLLVDGDGLIYRCGFAVEKTKYLVDCRDGTYSYFDTYKEAKAFEPDGEVDIWSRKDLEPVENALSLVKGAIAALPECEGMEIWLSPSVGNFRDSLATYAKYKGSRDFVKRPTYHKEITAYLVERGAEFTVGQEADDALGIRAGAVPEPCIVSFDKDLDQIPGMHYNWVTKEQYAVSPREGQMNFYRQALAGDTTDNVPGCEGVGPATAARLLEGVSTPREAWIAVLGAYTEVYGPVEGGARALETARLVYVRRKPGETWQPPV
jgi:hypothetical protein